MSEIKQDKAVFIRQWASILLLLVCLLPMLAFARSAQPMRFELTPRGAGATQIVIFNNDSSQPMTMEMTPMRILGASSEGELLETADNDFMIFPPTAVVPPGATQRFQVQYIGDPKLAASRSYRIHLRQSEVDLTGDGSVVGVAIGFGLMANVVPPNVKPELKLGAAKPAGPGKVAVTAENIGSKYIRLVATEWVVDGNSLSGDDIATLSGNLIVPGEKRQLILPVSSGKADKVGVLTYN